MASKNNEFQVDDLLNNLDGGRNANKANKSTTKAKQTSDWADEEDDNTGLGFANDRQVTTKAKTQKKKGGDKGWSELEAEAQPTKTTDFEKIQTDQEKKPKLFQKPTGQPKPAKNVEIDAEYFPSLGEEAPKKPVKKNPEPVEQSPVATNANAGGPRKFVNAKKQGQGENFVPLDPNVVEKALPPVSVPEKTPEEPTQRPAAPSNPVHYELPERKPGESGIVRRGPSDTQPEVPVDTKFKFGGEGPKKFAGGNKISFKRDEEQKSELETLREQREREIEEKLIKEREEAALRQKEFRDRKPKEEGEKTEQKDAPEQPQEERRPARFTNSKKETSKTNSDGKSQATPAPVENTLQETSEVKTTQPKEQIEMHGTLSNKGWGEGPILKKPQKK